MTVVATKEFAASNTGTLEVSIGAGDTTPAYDVDKAALITVHPVSGGSVLVQYTTSTAARVAAGTARWIDWDLGTVIVASGRMIQNATAVRATATTQAAVMEIRQ